MILNNNKKFNNTIYATTINHNFEGFEKFNKPYQTFNTSLNDYYIILDSNDLDSNELLRSLVSILKNNPKEFNIDMDSFFKTTNNNFNDQIIHLVVIGSELGSTLPYCAKTEKPELASVNIVLDEKYKNIYDESLNIATAQSFARYLQDAPSNEIVPGTFVEHIKSQFKDVKNVTISVMERKELEEKKMNLLVGVGQAAVRDIDQPRLLTISFMNDKTSDVINAFVGKGVCFDTGGLNIKTAGHMRWMKYDMSGAAVASMTIYALAKNNIKGNFIAVCPLVINLCDTVGQRPDDVLTSYSGKTVEIDNTDAEGRLILADALTYATKDLKAKRVFDIATLTGAMIYGLGDTYTGVWSTSDCLWNRIQKASNFCGELVWRMPFHRDFLEMLKSDVADIANSVSDPRGGSSRAACFLKEFTNDVKYAHFDVAATASNKNLATGIMLNTFYYLAKSFDESNGCCNVKK